MSERWRDTYDQWKLATPPEHEGDDEQDEDGDGLERACICVGGTGSCDGQCNLGDL